MADKNKQINSASQFGSFTVSEDQPDSVMTGLKAAGIENRERITKGAAAGCKPGSIRHTYVMPLVMINKLKAIAGYFGKPEVGLVLEFLDKCIAECEAQYGPAVSSLNRAEQKII